MSTDDELLSIGELARRTGVRPSALRFYEEAGLLAPTQRVAGRRRYRPSALRRVALMRLCQDAGFSLSEIEELLSDRARPRRGWRQLAERKIAGLEIRITEAQQTKEMLEHALQCPEPDLADCPVFRSAVDARLVPATDTTTGRSLVLPRDAPAQPDVRRDRT